MTFALGPAVGSTVVVVVAVGTVVVGTAAVGTAAVDTAAVDTAVVGTAVAGRTSLECSRAPVTVVAHRDDGSLAAGRLAKGTAVEGSLGAVGNGG